MADGLGLVELSGPDEGKEISLQTRFIFAVQLGQRLILPRRRVGVELGHVTAFADAAAADARTPQRVERVFPRLCLVGEELDLSNAECGGKGGGITIG